MYFRIFANIPSDDSVQFDDPVHSEDSIYPARPRWRKEHGVLNALRTRRISLNRKIDLSSYLMELSY